MKQLTINGKVLGVVDVPDGASDYNIFNNIFNNYLQIKRGGFWDSIRLPPGHWVIMGRLDSIIGEQAAEIRSNGVTGNPLIILNEKV